MVVERVTEERRWCLTLKTRGLVSFGLDLAIAWGSPSSSELLEDYWTLAILLWARWHRRPTVMHVRPESGRDDREQW